jgi:DNA-binding transcriptional ArsR family regulator
MRSLSASWLPLTSDKSQATSTICSPVARRGQIKSAQTPNAHSAFGQILFAHLFCLPLDNIPISEYNADMARLPTTSDVFNAIAEPQRREILSLLTTGERSVNDLVEALGLKQPQVSKHLKVLRAVGLVSVREVGQQRLYRLNAQGLKPIYDWVTPFERLWHERLDRLDAYLKQLQSAEKEAGKEEEEKNVEQS